MERALVLARRGQGRVEPNPMVGAVIVDGDTIVAEGWHRRFGRPHAEREAIAACRNAGVDPRGLTMYVTLEPCFHVGKTPPCTEAILEAGLARICIAMVDPFPQVAGRGLKRLREAGVEVITGICESQSEQLNAPYVRRITEGLPWVIAKWAQTLDGRIATRTGDSRWISNDQSRHLVHQLRARVDAIIIGIGTARTDDPQLTARGVRLRRTARRVVIDPRLRLPEECRLLRSLESGGPPVMLVYDERIAGSDTKRVRRLHERGVELVSLPRDAQTGHLSVRAVLHHLAKAHDATNVLVEGGSAVTGDLLADDLIDEAMVFVAPMLMGDAKGVPAARGRTVETISQCRQLRLHHVRRYGDDVLLHYRRP